ncbi:MAG: phage BR0599 family protein [Planctomycetota bacterium]|nr:phage BR0599 family protein [Planctomycetota bacterium]
MSVAPRGIFCLPVHALAAMLANCASFQKLVQAASATAALAKVYPFGIAGEPARPFAVVGHEDWRPEAVAGGTRLEYANLGVLSILTEVSLKLEAAVTTANSTTVFRLSGLVGLKNDHFNGLKVKILSGAAKNEIGEISDFDGATGEITLAGALPAAPQVGDTLRIYPGSDQDAYTWFMNTMGDIAAELLAQSGAGTDLNTVDSGMPAGFGCLALRQPRQEVFQRAAPDKQAVDHLLCVWEFDYGR